ncbi:MAG: amidohydrolase family protein [Wenzhouxiangella sp.]|nr:amidohydrolase family protein [Wenzhouxiangella sp.]
MRLLLILLLISSSVWADDLRQATPGVHALVGVNVVTSPGESISNATIVIRDGIITDVGTDLTPPPDARLHEFERDAEQPPITVYPGFIDPYLVIEAAEMDNNDEETATATPTGRHPLIRADRQITAAEWPGDRLDALREAGFTTALLAPSDGLIQGSGVVANLGDGELSHNLLVPTFGQFVSFTDRLPGRQYPNSLMGAVSLVRQTFDDAAWQRQARAAWQRNPAQARPQWLEGVDALAPALGGEQPTIFVASDMPDTLRILEFTQGRELDLVIVGHGEEYKRPGGIVDQRVPHILPLNFPDAPDVRDENDLNVSLEELRHWRAAPGNPARLREAEVPVLFTTHGLTTPKDHFKALVAAVEAGLDPDESLAALTTAPATLLGIEDRAGRIQEGYMANLIVVEGDLMVEDPSINAVWIDGREHVLAVFSPPTVDPAGLWELTLRLGSMGDMPATMSLSGSPTSMTGSLNLMGNDSSLSSVRVSGDEVIATLDATRFGGSGTVTLRLSIDGDRARGNGNGPYGPFAVRGQRSSAPDEEDA